MGEIKLLNMDCMEYMKGCKDKEFDIVLADPPYLYLKGQKLDRQFDEVAFFNECKRILKRDSIVLLFGRGTSFYRWNTFLADLGFEFKEEIIWDKGNCTSPVLPMSRVHETISIHISGKRKIHKTKIPYLEMKGGDIKSIARDIKRLITILGNNDSLNAVKDYLENNNKLLKKDHIDKHTVSCQPGVKQINRAAAVMASIQDGMSEQTIIRTDSKEYLGGNGLTVRGNLEDRNRCVKVINSISKGMNEKSIIQEDRDHYNTIHPTQKPVRLIQRLLKVVANSSDKIFIPFSGSGAFEIAAYEAGLEATGCEIDKDYYQAAVKRFTSHKSQTKLQFAS